MGAPVSRNRFAVAAASGFAVAGVGVYLSRIARYARPVLGPMGRLAENAGRAATPSKADCIIVPGAWVSADGAPSEALLGRVEHALELVERSVASHVLFTGGAIGGRAVESDVAARVAIDHGFDPSRIVLERTSTNTFENLKNARPIMAARGWATAVICTDAVHIPRCLWLARTVGIRATGSAAAKSFERMDDARREALATREALAIVGYFAFWPYFRATRR